MTVVPLTGTANAQVYPELGEAAKAAAKYITANGGIKGRPLNVIVCDDQNDPNKAASCGREAASKKVAAVLGSFTLFGDSLVPILESAKIPYLAPCCAISHKELTSPVAYNITPGNPLLHLATGVIGARYCRKPAIVVTSDASSDFLIDLKQRGLRTAGKSAVKVVKIPSTAQDYAPFVAQASSGTDCFITRMNQPNLLVWLASMQQADVHHRLVVVAGNIDNTVLERFPKFVEGALIVDFFRPFTDPSWAAYRKAFAKYSNPAKYNSSLLGAKVSWLSYMVFREVAKSTNQVTSSTMLAALKRSKAVQTGNLLPPVNFTKPWEVTDFARLFNRTIMYEIVKKNKIVSLDGKFHDLSKAFKSTMK